MDRTEQIKQRRLSALMHYNLVKEEYPDEIKKSIDHSEIIEVREVNKNRPRNREMLDNIPEIHRCSSSQDILFVDPEIKGRKFCILNFADSITPGGGYFKGYTTQEEELCSTSTLLPVLEAFKESVYAQNRRIDERYDHPYGIYSPDIIFFGEDGEERVADVISLAAPNMNYLFSREDGPIPGEIGLSETMSIVCYKRLEAIYNVAEDHGVTDLVLGAWGCGAYGNDINDIARSIHILSLYSSIQTHIVLTSDHSEEVFKGVMEERL